MDNRLETKKFVSAVALVIYALITIAVCAGVWNFCPAGAVKVGAALLLAANAVVAVKWYNNIHNEEE